MCRLQKLEKKRKINPTKCIYSESEERLKLYHAELCLGSEPNLQMWALFDTDVGTLALRPTSFLYHFTLFSDVLLRKMLTSMRFVAF